MSGSSGPCPACVQSPQAPPPRMGGAPGHACTPARAGAGPGPGRESTHRLFKPQNTKCQRWAGPQLWPAASRWLEPLGLEPSWPRPPPPAMLTCCACWGAPLLLALPRIGLPANVVLPRPWWMTGPALSCWPKRKVPDSCHCPSCRAWSDFTQARTSFDSCSVTPR